MKKRTISLTLFLCLTLGWSSFSFLSPAAAESAETPAQTAPRSSETMRDAVLPFIENGSVPGMVSVVALKDKVLAFDCVGWADIENGRKMAPDTLFAIASETKLFTSAAIMTLVEAGKVDLDAPLEKYLPELTALQVVVTEKKIQNASLADNQLNDYSAANKIENVKSFRAPKTKPTVRQALCHMAGWKFSSPEMAQNGIDSIPISQMPEKFAQFPLTADPGVKYEYSQIGVDLCGAIIERVSGMPYEEYLAKTFFEPMGMKNTTFWPTQEQCASQLARSYRSQNKNLVPAKLSLLSSRHEFWNREKRFPEPAGGLFSTGEDLVKFFQMLAGKGVYDGKRYLSEESVLEIARRQTPDHVKEPRGNYGLCCFRMDGGWFRHGGAFGTDSLVHLENGYVKIFLIQNSGYGSGGIKGAWNQAADKILNESSQK